MVMKNLSYLKVGCVFYCAILSAAHADTTAFGMTLGKTTLEEFRKIYPSSVHEGTSSWTDGDIYSIPVNDIDFDGVKKDFVLFNEEGKITAISIDLDKERFNKIHGMLERKYKTTKKDIPFVGNKFVRYKNGNDLIELDAPHLSFKLTLLYAEKRFMDTYLKKKAEGDSKKDSEESDKL